MNRVTGWPAHYKLTLKARKCSKCKVVFKTAAKNQRVCLRCAKQFLRAVVQ